MALYRRHRPERLDQVLGQEHVTKPLSIALEAGRINHAYLFSGPRGCGKTSLARILARSVNCEKGPTARPCGACESCLALTEGGPGSVDVIELDAASHGGVDDTRELRDRAFYAPARSRKRVFIIDEAHMVTSAGFNALLKIVEEPPPHLIFVFATTEPEKVLPTIRSRTHHYPFRLLAPKTLRELLARVCAAEEQLVEPEVYPLVIKASGGSPRDALSILDQLISGTETQTVTYASAVALLGVTNASLLDDAVTALAAGDGAGLFGVVDRCVNAGGDPRRFAVDLLDRLRDLILLQAVPDALEQGLVDAPAEAWGARREQAVSFGPGTLARCAETLHTGLSEMRGATSPRLLLEVVCARMLLPLEDSEALLARVERLERGGVARPERPEGELAQQPPPAAPPGQHNKEPLPLPHEPEEPAAVPAQKAPEVARTTLEPERPAQPSAPPVVNSPLAEIWPKVLSHLRERARVTYALLDGSGMPELRGDVLVLRHSSAALFARLSDPKVLEVVAAALREVAGVQWQVTGEHGPSTAASHNREAAPVEPAGAAPANQSSSAEARRALLNRSSPAPRRDDAIPAPGDVTAPAGPPPDALTLLSSKLGATPLDK